MRHSAKILLRMSKPLYRNIDFGFWATVYGSPYAIGPLSCLSVCLSVCPAYLSATLVYCGQTVGRIKMKLGMQVGLGPGHIVLDGNPPPLPKGHSL